MSSFQKVIKYIAVAVAVFIIFSIISGVIAVVSVLGNLFSNDKRNYDLDEIKIESNYKVLDVELNSVNILIKKANEFSIETDSDNISFKEVGNRLLITEKKSGWLPKKANSDLVIYVDDDFIFDEVSINNGAGRLDIDYIGTKELELEIGAGKVNFNKLDVYEEMSIDGGAGEVIIKDGIVNNLDLDMGIGKVKLNLEIKGTSEIDAGIGEVNLNLIGKDSDYKINVSKGIGKIDIAGIEAVDDTSYGMGENILDINGGIGNISINFEE